MKNTESLLLFQLIQSLNEAEIKYITQYFSRLSGGAKHSARLFSAMRKQKIYDEEKLKKTETYISGFAQQKQVLYKLILRALREFSEKDTAETAVRNLMRDAEILREKRFYTQALRQLQKASELADALHNPLLLLELIQQRDDIRFESNVLSPPEENAHTRKAEEAYIAQLELTVRHKWLAKEMHFVHLRSHQLPDEKSFSAQHLELLSAKPPDVFKARFYYEKAQTTYNFTLQKTAKAASHALQCLQLLEANRNFTSHHPHELLRALSTILVLQDIDGDRKAASVTIQRMRQLMREYKQELSAFAGHTFIYTYTTEFNLYCRHGNYNEAIKLIPEILSGIQKFRSRIAFSEEVVFWFNFAQAYLCTGDYKNAFRWADKVFSNRQNNRYDLAFTCGLILLLSALKRLELPLFRKLHADVVHKLDEMQLAPDLINEFGKWTLALAGASNKKQKHSLLGEMHEMLLHKPWSEQARLALHSFVFENWLRAELQGKTISRL
jgi:tetratricopeptide (TPR) repeat protein